MPLTPRPFAASLLICLLASTSPSFAVGPRAFELDTLEEVSGGDLRGVSVRGDGVIVPGWTLGNVPLPEVTTAHASVLMPDGALLVGTGGKAKIFRVVGERATEWATLEGNAVSSLVLGPNNTVYAATFDGAKIFKVTQGKVEAFATLPDADSVLSLAYDRAKNVLYASASGTGGARVFRMDAGGAPSVFLANDEPFFTALSVASSGELLVGTQGKGLFLRVKEAGRAVVVHDFSEGEVRAIVEGPKGGVYVLANDGLSEGDSSPLRRGGGRSLPGPSGTSLRRSGKGSLYRVDAEGRAERLMHHDEFHYMTLAVDKSGTPYVGTGAEGRVYTVDDRHLVTLVGDTDERQVASLHVSDGAVWAVSSDPAVVHRVLSVGGVDSVWTSRVFDCGLRAHFGHLTYEATGALDVATRTGNTPTPDGTWSAWTNPLATGASIPSGPGRYVQMRARWGRDPKATLSRLVVPFITDNLRAVLLEVTAQQKGVSREKKEGIVASVSEPGRHDSVVRVSWRIDNPDQDPMRYRLWFQRQGQAVWRELTRPEEAIAKSDFDWETSALPEGKYRIRVEASDEAANPPDKVFRHTLESAPVLVDNTPPVVQSLSVTGRKLKGKIVDGLGPIVRAEFAVDGKVEWRPLAAADGLFDTADESIDADISAAVPPGSHIVAVRAYDAAGNLAVREVETN